MLFRLPIHLYRAGLGFVLGHRFVLINHLGRRSGRVRQAVVEVVSYDQASGTITVASGFGPGADWYRNLLAHPDVTVQLSNHRRAVHALALSAEEGAQVMADYASRHPRAARSLSRFMGFRVDGSIDDYRRMGREIPFIRFEPAETR